jgi:hypothetical protein
MTVETKHPAFNTSRVSEYKLMAASAEGESAIKLAAETYLPKPSGFRTDNNNAMYAAYKNRAQFPDIVSPTVSAMVGIIHGKEIAIEKPDSMAYVDEKATLEGLSLEAFHRRITSALLKKGRYGVLVDAPESGGDPYMCGYDGDRIINWESDGSFYVIDDSGSVRTGYDWTDENKHIVLEMLEGSYTQKEVKDAGELEITPGMRGGGALERIPFVVANARDISTDMLPPPLIGVARAALAIYQLSADYRHQLFMSGQETLVIINGDAPTAIGAGVVHELRGSEGMEPDAKYVGPDCAGIEAHERAMESNKQAAILAGAKLLEQDDKGVNESGKARKLRFASETATLSDIAKVSCEVLEKSLRNVAMMQGLSEAEQEKITVTPPKDLMDTTITPQDAKALVEAWQAGGFSYRTLHENLIRGGIANPERELEDELLEMDDDPEAIRQAQLEAITPAK